MDIKKHEEKKQIAFWSAGKPAKKEDFAEGEIVLVKGSDGTKQRSIFSKSLINDLEKYLSSGEVHWVSITRL